MAERDASGSGDESPTRGVSLAGGAGGATDEAPLAPGLHLGRYEIRDLLGSGGMGRVYRALDPSLGREVAIKALAHTFRDDSGNLRRFEREARVLAVLSHPNIAAIYGFERLDGAPYLILECVDGEALSTRLRRGPLPFREALNVALQVVEGLEAAHAKGVIHRDLKPSNIMLTPPGRAKLVDFGLAKSVPAPADTEDPQSADPITMAGAVLGTAAYMSPEQIRGDDVDTRTDVWSFGCVLYEMLVGHPPFGGRSMGEVLAAVLRDDPVWSELPDSVPPAIRRLLRHCLRRDPHARLQHIGDARLELVEAETEEIVQPAVQPARSRAGVWVPWLIAAVCLAVLAPFLAIRWSRPVPVPRTARLSLELPPSLALATGYAAPFALSPSGSTLVLLATEGETARLYARELNDTAPRALHGTEGASQPFFSPDGRFVAFFANRSLSKVPVGGGAALPLAEIGGGPRGGTWSSSGAIVVAPSQTSGLVRLPEQGGRLEPLTTLDPSKGEYSHRWPEALPGGEWVLFTVGLEDATFDEGRIEAVSLRTRERRLILSGAGFARYSAGRLLFVREGRLHAVSLDPGRLEMRGEPEVVVDAVRYDPRNGGSHVSLSASGVFLYGPGVPTARESYLVWVDRSGELTRIADTPRRFRDPRLSPDGRRIAVAIGSSTESDLWLVDGNATLSRLSFGLSPHRPVWSPDGRRIAAGAVKDGRWRLLSLPIDEPGQGVVLFESDNRLYPAAWSPDGRRLVFQEKRPVTGWDLRVVSLGETGVAAGPPADVAATPFQETSAALSLDGRLLAYESDEIDGVFQIYARPFLDPGAKVRVSSSGARRPVWGPDGRLFYWNTGLGRLCAATIGEERGGLVVGPSDPVWGSDAREPEPLTRLVVSWAAARYDVDRATGRVLALETATPRADPPLARPVVVLDWPTTTSAR